MKRLLLLLLAAAAVGALLLSGVLRGGPGSAAGLRGTAEVRRGDLKIVLQNENGTFKAKNSTPILSQAAAKIEWIVEEGKRVTKDEVLVELDKQDVKRLIEDLQNQVTQGESELKSARTEELIQADQNKTDTEKAELNLEVARVTLRKFLEGDVPQELRKRKLAVEKADSDLKQAKDRLDAYEQLRKEDFVTQNELEQAQIQHRQAENELESAKLSLQLYEQYEQPIDRKKKEADVAEAERGLERARKRAEAQLEAKQALVRQRDLTLKSTKDRLQREQETLSRMTIRAPTDGTVLYGSGENGRDEEQYRAGTQVWPSMVLITLPDPSEMAAVIQVHEADIDRIRVGTPAFITSETQKGKVFSGRIAKIDSVANAGDRWRGDNVKKFKVEIDIEGKDLDLKPGTSARVEVVIGERSDVLQVPLQAIRASGGKFHCWVDRNGVPERVEVRPGQSNESHIEIQSGLEEGWKVLLHDPEGASGGEAEGSAPSAKPSAGPGQGGARPAPASPSRKP